MGSHRIGGRNVRVAGIRPESYSALTDAVLDRLVTRMNSTVAKFQEPVHVVLRRVKSDCPSCTRDPMTGLVDPDCQVCNGTGSIITEDSRLVNAVPDYVTKDNFAQYDGGFVKVGDIALSISAAELERTDLGTDDLINAVYVNIPHPQHVDSNGLGRDYEIVRWKISFLIPDMLADRMTGVILMLTRFEDQS